MTGRMGMVNRQIRDLILAFPSDTMARSQIRDALPHTGSKSYGTVGQLNRHNKGTSANKNLTSVWFSKELKDLEKRGAIRREGDLIRILDRSKVHPKEASHAGR